MLLLLSLTALAAPAAEPPYTVAARPWPEALGHQRAHVTVAAPGEVRVRLPWRRTDPQPAAKAVVVTDAVGHRLERVLVLACDRERGDVAFAAPAAGDYYVYWLSFAVQGGAGFSQTAYQPAKPPADAAWAEQTRAALDRLPFATLAGFEARTAFDRRDPMELPATAAERDELLARCTRAYLVFPEDRGRGIRLKRDLPADWTARGPSDTFTGTALRDEFYVFQLGVYAARQALSDVSVEFGDLRCGAATIAAGALRCFNTGGVDWLGHPLRKRVDVAQGQVQALWCGVQVPPDAAPGLYTGLATVKVAGADATPVTLALTVAPERLPDHGDSQPERLSRLRWLDSTLALDDEVTAPYTPVTLAGQTAGCLGRTLTFGESGLPTALTANGQAILAAPVRFVVTTAAGEVALTGAPPRVTRQAAGSLEWESVARGGGLALTTRARFEFDGHVRYELSLHAEGPVALTDVRLELPLARESATLMMGLNRKGGKRPATWDWKWDRARHQDSVWLGSPRAGVQLQLWGDNYVRPLVNIHYHHKPLNLPPSWSNGGAGGVRLAEAGPLVNLTAFSGPRTLAAGETQLFGADLLLTPFHPLNTRAQFTERYSHAGSPAKPADEAATGANIVNIHQGNALNPWINYPFLTVDPLRRYIDEAHRLGLKVKVYDTVRELTNHLPELWALRSLGDEVLLDGQGGGFSWLQEHLGSGYVPAWYQHMGDAGVDASILTAGMSRWHNFYLEGLRWLVDNVGIDGLYIDDVAYDRVVTQRARKVLDRGRPGSRIDLHSWNHFNGQAGFANCANLYLANLPYIDRIWFGEGFDYNESPDYWLVELSGIPYGLMGEMLQGGGNPWRGMVYGMTQRLKWSGDPRPLWKLFDELKLSEATLQGYWDPACPVRTGREDVLATVYRLPGRALISVASWAKAPVNVDLQLDWAALGLAPAKAHLYAPPIAGFQSALLLDPGEPLPVKPGRGWLLLVDEQPHDAPHPAVAAPDKAGATRRVVFDDAFAGDRLGDGWTPLASKRPGTQVAVAGGQLAFAAAANTVAAVERALPAGTTMVAARFDTGTDEGKSWGPGLALVWPDGRALRVNLRTPEGRTGVDGAGGQQFPDAPVAPHTPVWLRWRREAEEWLAEASEDGKTWLALTSVARAEFPGEPVKLRLGKLDPGSRGQDHGEPGPAGRCAVGHLTIWQ